MIRRPPRSTRTDTLFPYTTLFRSQGVVGEGFGRRDRQLFAALKGGRSEEHTSELQSLMRISYAVFCLKKKKVTIPMNEEKLHTCSRKVRTSNKPAQTKKHRRRTARKAKLQHH